MATLNTELSKAFRYMLLHIAGQLTTEECQGIVFAEGLPSSCKNETNLEVLSHLEANGEYSPLNPDGLQTLLIRINRYDLLQPVKEYKKSPLFQKAQKELAKEEKRARKKKDGKSSDARDTMLACVEPMTETDVKVSGPSCDPQSMLREAYAITLTHTTLLLQQVELLRKAIEADAAPKNLLQVRADPTHQRNRTDAAFQAIADAEDSVEKLRKNLRRALSAVHVGNRSSCSSAETTCTSGTSIATCILHCCRVLVLHLCSKEFNSSLGSGFAMHSYINFTIKWL